MPLNTECLEFIKRVKLEQYEEEFVKLGAVMLIDFQILLTTKFKLYDPKPKKSTY